MRRENRKSLERRYQKAREQYARTLPSQHETVRQAKQRQIMLCSLDLLQSRRKDVQHFNELLVQYPLLDQDEMGQVIPDNMVIIHHDAVGAIESYDLPFHPARPFWVIDYVSRLNHRKDYDDNSRRYEKDLKVPFYMRIDVDHQQMNLYRHNGGSYVAVAPNEQGRYAVEDIEVEVAIAGDVVRYWHRGALLRLPAELYEALVEVNRRLAEFDTGGDKQ